MTDKQLETQALWFRVMNTHLTYDATTVYLRADGYPHVLPIPRDANLPARLDEVKVNLTDLHALEAAHARHS